MIILQKLLFPIGLPQWHTQEKISGIQGYGRPRRGSRGGAPGRRRIVENLQTKFLDKIAKYIILAYFSKNLTNHSFLCRAFGRKLQIVLKFLMKIQ